MEIVVIEKKTFEQMVQAFQNFASQIKNLCGNNRENGQWLSNGEVCGLLGISQRTLQTYRDNRILPYSRIGHKCYYKISDIENLVSQSKNKKEQ